MQEVASVQIPPAAAVSDDSWSERTVWDLRVSFLLFLRMSADRFTRDARCSARGFASDRRDFASARGVSITRDSGATGRDTR